MSIDWQTEKKELAPPISDWLLHRDSMTEKLKSCCHDRFEVEVLSHEPQALLPEDCSYLNLSVNENTIVREVVLLCDGKPWVFARTVIPGATVQSHGLELITLGSRPLGEILFSDPDVTRSEFELAKIAAENIEQLHCQQAIEFIESHSKQLLLDSLWARRSIFTLPNKGNLAVTEVFLSSCWQH